MNFTSRLRKKIPLILDGAMGTELCRRGISIELPLWSAGVLLENPEIVKKIHMDYIKAGADIITTNTFRTNSRTFLKAGFTKKDAFSATKMSASIARSAINTLNPDRKIWIAGSISPLEDCYQPELSPDYETALIEHRENAMWLAEAGVDFILIETMNTLHEALAASRTSLETKLPVITSFILDTNGNIFDGSDLFIAYTELKNLGIQGFSINCTHHSIISQVIDNYLTKITLPVAAYANSGIYDKEFGWKDDPDFTPDSYANIAHAWISKGVKIVGGCCGTTPEHIKKISAKIKSPE